LGTEIGELTTGPADAGLPIDVRAIVVAALAAIRNFGTPITLGDFVLGAKVCGRVDDCGLEHQGNDA